MQYNYCKEMNAYACTLTDLSQDRFIVGSIVLPNRIYFIIYYMLGEKYDRTNNYIAVIKIEGVDLNPYTFKIKNDLMFVHFDQINKKVRMFDINNFRLRDSNSYLSKLNNDPRNNLYLLKPDGKLVKDEKNNINLQDGTFTMSSDEEKEYRKRLGETVSINVTKLNDIQFGYKVRRQITSLLPLRFDL